MKSIRTISFQINFLLFFLSIIVLPFKLFCQQIDSLVQPNKKRTTEIPLNKTSDSLALKELKLNTTFPDTVFLKNGDKVTGKILSFEQGRLKIDGQGPGVVSIKWYKISSISGGNRIYKVDEINGTKHIGKIESAADTGKIHLTNEAQHDILIEDIIRIFPLEEEWYRGFKGTLGAGLNYAKSSDVLTINAEYNLYYVVKKWRFINDFSFISTSESNEKASLRTQVNLQAIYSLPNRWLLYEINSFNRNDELGVKSRFSFGGGGGNSLVQTEWQRLLILTGLIVNLEKDIETNSIFSNVEWPATLQHTIYKFARPQLSSSTSITSYVGITEKGRHRIDASVDLTWEFISNFNLQLSFYYNYDNKSIEGKNTKRDYGTVLSLLLDLK